MAIGMRYWGLLPLARLIQAALRLVIPALACQLSLVCRQGRVTVALAPTALDVLAIALLGGQQDTRRITQLSLPCLN